MIRLTTAAVAAGILIGAVLTSAHYLDPAPAADTATATTTLTAGQSLMSGNGDYELVMTTDGDLVEESLHGVSPIIVEVNDPDGNAYLGGGNVTAIDGNYTVSGTLVGSDSVQIWDSGTGGHPDARAVMQTDGNFVIYSADNAVLWSAGTAGHPGARLVVQSDANVVLYDGSQALWSTRRVSIVDGHGSDTVNLRNCLGWTDFNCGILQQLPAGTGITMLCWQDVPPPGWGTPPPSNRWFYSVIDGTQDELGFIDAGFVDNQIETPPCIGELRPGQSPSPAPVPVPSTPAAGPEPAPPSAAPSEPTVTQPVTTTAPSPPPASGPPPAPAPAPPPPATYTETVGGPTHTWEDYSDAGGSEGPTIPTGESVQVACYVQGFKVADGNTYWYRIASSPWGGSYYASADAFYNNGATSGSLDGTPFVDPAVPAC
jgi:hypothetical protein